jgi:hypothetical protein
MSAKNKAREQASAKEMSRLKRQAGLTKHAGHSGTQAEEGWKRQMAAFPVDTRGLTARLCGDPLPGRSALDRDRIEKIEG